MTEFNYTAKDAMRMVEQCEARLREINLVDPDLIANLALVHEYLRRHQEQRVFQATPLRT